MAAATTGTIVSKKDNSLEDVASVAAVSEDVASTPATLSTPEAITAALLVLIEKEDNGPEDVVSAATAVSSLLPAPSVSKEDNGPEDLLPAPSVSKEDNGPEDVAASATAVPVSSKEYIASADYDPEEDATFMEFVEYMVHLST